MSGTIPPPRPLSRNTPVSQLTAGDIAYLLAWQAHLITRPVPTTPASAVDALFPPPPQRHRWGLGEVYDTGNSTFEYSAKCSLCGAQVVNEDPVALNRQVAAEDAKGCPGAPVGAP